MNAFRPLVVHAEGMTNDQLHALNEWPNWVGNCGATGIIDSAMPDTPADSNLNQGGTVYILGDSITNLAKDSYVKKFSSNSSNSKWTTIVQGLDSRHIMTDPPSPSGYDELDQDAGSVDKATAVVIALGTNDYGNNPTSLQKDVEKTIKKTKSLQHKHPSAPIYWVNVYVNNHDAEAKRANSAIAAAAKDNGVSVIDWYSEAKSKAAVASFAGNVHPTKQHDIDVLVDLVYKNVSQSQDDSAQAASSDVSSVECCSTDASGGDVSFEGNDNAKIIFDFFVSKGLTPMQAAAITGNSKVESAGTFDPTIVQGGGHSNNPDDAGGGGYGLFQWTGGHTLITNAEKYHIDGKPYTIEFQLKVIWAELQGSEAQALKDVKAANNILDATWAFMGSSSAAGGDGRFVGFERPADQSRAAAVKRAAGSRLILAKYGGDAAMADIASADSGDSSSICCPPSASGDSASSGEVNDGSPSDWTKLYTGANKSKVDSLAHGDLKSPNVLVIHYTVGEQEGQDLLDYFTHTPYGIQFNVGKTGKIYQYFPLSDMKVVYHAKGVNSKAIGIEITGKDVNDLMNNDQQFQSVVTLAKYLCDKYNIPCSQPKGDITGDSAADAQGMIGHDETPTNDHVDPDATAQQASSGGLSRTDSSKHPYMMKLRQAMGFDPTPGSKGGGGSSGPTASTGGSDQCSQPDSASGQGTTKDPVGDGVNKALALEAVKYDTKANNNKYTYGWGKLHGPVSEMEKFSKDGGETDCSGFVRYVIWRVYGTDVGGFTTQTLPSMSQFKEVSASEVQAGDIGWRSDHVDFITQNKGSGKLHQFGAHSEDTDLYGDDTSPTSYQRFFRYVGPKNNGGT